MRCVVRRRGYRRWVLVCAHGHEVTHTTWIDAMSEADACARQRVVRVEVVTRT